MTMLQRTRVLSLLLAMAMAMAMTMLQRTRVQAVPMLPSLLLAMAMAMLLVRKSVEDIKKRGCAFKSTERGFEVVPREAS